MEEPEEGINAPLNSVVHYVQGLLDGLPSPQYAPAVAYVSAGIPVPDVNQQLDIGGTLRPVPIIYIWAVTIHEDRQTMPRGPGWKKLTYRLDVILQVMEDPDDVQRPTAFSCLYDAVRFAVNITPITTFITDPVTGYQSQVLQIGEELDSEIFVPENIGPGGQGWVRSGARLTLKIEEAVQSL